MSTTSLLNRKLRKKVLYDMYQSRSHQVGAPGGNVGVGILGPHDTWFVDPAISSGDGRTWTTAFDTMTEAIAACSSGDTSMLTGLLTEDVTTLNDYATGPADITIKGVGANPRRPLWMGANAAPIVKLNCEGFHFENIRFNLGAGYEGLYLRQESGSGGAYMTTVKNCLFQGTTATKAGIQLYGAPHTCFIENNYFNDILGTGGTGIECDDTSTHVPGGMTIAHNRFHNCSNYIDMASCGSTEFLHNNFMAITGGVTQVVRYLYFRNVSATYKNVMFGNIFGGDYSIAGGYQFNTNDSWQGNWAIDTAEGEVDAIGHVLGIPA